MERFDYLVRKIIKICAKEGGFNEEQKNQKHELFFSAIDHILPIKQSQLQKVTNLRDLLLQKIQENKFISEEDKKEDKETVLTKYGNYI